MKNLKFVLIALLTVGLIGCSMFQNKEAPQTAAQSTQKGSGVTVDVNKEANNKAAELTNGWPQSSVMAAQEMMIKHGDPSEVTSDSLIWRNVAPFKKIIVHKEVYNDRFPLLHQTAVEHVVNYQAPSKKADDIWNYNGSIVLDRTKGEMSAAGDNEALNILSLNLADEIAKGKLSAEAARIKHGKETLNFLNGNKSEYTTTLAFGGQVNTPDSGESITNKIRWEGESKQSRKQSQEEDRKE